MPSLLGPSSAMILQSCILAGRANARVSNRRTCWARARSSLYFVARLSPWVHLYLTKITSLRAMGSEGINSCIIKSYHDWSRGWVSWHREWGWVLCQVLYSTILEFYQVGEHGVFCPCRTRRRGMHGNYTAAHTKQQLLWRPSRWTVLIGQWIWMGFCQLYIFSHQRRGLCSHFQFSSVNWYLSAS